MLVLESAKENKMENVEPTSVDEVSKLTVYDSYVEKQLLAAFYGVISIVGVLGNGSVLLAVVLSRKPRTTINVFVVNLALADLITCLSLPIMVLAVLSENSEKLLVSQNLCALQGFCLIVCIGCSLNNIATIGVYRALITSRKNRGERRWLFNRRGLAGTVALIWLVPFAIGLLPMISEFGSYVYDDKFSTCSFNPTAQKSGPFFKIMVSTYIPLQVLCILASYSFIFLKIRRQVRRVNVVHDQLLAVVSENMRLSTRPGASQQPPRLPEVESLQTNSHLLVYTVNNPVSGASSPSTTRATREQRDNRRHQFHRSVATTRTLFLVVFVFFVFVTPYPVSIFIVSDISKKLTPFLGMFCVANSCVNPIIYAARHPDFKAVMRCILTFRLSKIPLQSSLLRRMLAGRG